MRIYIIQKLNLITIKPYDNIKMPQAKKNRCKQCTTRHSPPTGKKCRYVQQETSDVEDSGLFEMLPLRGGSPSADPVSGQLIQQQMYVCMYVCIGWQKRRTPERGAEES